MARNTPMNFSASESRQDIAYQARKPWKVLIVDDEPVVHEITRQVLNRVEYEGRRLEFSSAFSGEEAKKLITEDSEIAVILLDVVMETDDAGLDVARFIRRELQNPFVRIILRTGQPGTAPERRIILDFDINDYKEKTELTSTRLLTTVISSLRDYSLITRMNRCLMGMEIVISAIRDLLRVRTYEKFAEGLLSQVLSLLNIDESGLYLGLSGCTAEESEDGYSVIAGTGEFADPSYKTGKRKLPRSVLKLIEQACEKENHLYIGDEFLGYISSEKDTTVRILYLRGVDNLPEIHRCLLETFLTNVNAGMDAVIEIQQLQESVS
jgi:CheY-like chemotaxis protein